MMKANLTLLKDDALLSSVVGGMSNPVPVGGGNFKCLLELLYQFMRLLRGRGGAQGTTLYS